jgi:hypothetical protein
LAGWRVVGILRPGDIAVKLLADSFAVDYVVTACSGQILKALIVLGSGNGGGRVWRSWKRGKSPH